MDLGQEVSWQVGPAEKERLGADLSQARRRRQAVVEVVGERLDSRLRLSRCQYQLDFGAHLFLSRTGPLLCSGGRVVFGY